jgi:hypothetical protein
MSLLRLLAAGKSLVGLEGSQSRYQLTRQGMLPRFGPKKNPFRATTRPESQTAASVPAPAADLPGRLEKETRKAQPENKSSVNTGVAATVPGSAGAPMPERREAGGLGGERPKPLSPVKNHAPTSESGTERFASRLGALFPWRRPVTARPAIPSFAKPMVQAELSLESVKVVRNDLSDSDLEVVRAKLPPASPSAAPAAPKAAAHRAVAETPWARVTGRLFGLGKP